MEDLSRAACIPRTNNLWKYLGAQLLHQRSNKETYKELLGKFNNRLAGWKTKCLSLVGRITLARSVLNSLLVFQMQATKLLAYITKDIDKLTLYYIWGGDAQRKKIHLINWPMCKPMKNGGMCLKWARETNMALLAKMGWRMLQESKSRLGANSLELNMGWAAHSKTSSRRSTFL